MTTKDVIIVGAGPAGLATAIAATRAGLDCQVVEKGVLVNSLFHYPTHMVFFTTPELMEIGGLPFVTPYEKPTRLEALRYYRRAADAYNLDILLGEEVISVGRERAGDGEVLAVETRSTRGVRRARHTRTVVIATGAFDVPNRLGVPGEDLPHASHYYREAHPHYRQNVVVVGGRNSAAEAALDLYRHGAHVTLVHRGPALSDSIKYWVKPDLENRIREGAIAALFETAVVEIQPAAVVVSTGGVRRELPADAVFLLTGYRSDTELLRRAGVAIDPDTCGPVHDPQTFETNVPGVYVAGAVVAGVHSGKIFIENGRFHGEVVVRSILKRLGARAG
jgi:thioredoxin reductase (NADPH)